MSGICKNLFFFFFWYFALLPLISQSPALALSVYFFLSLWLENIRLVLTVYTCFCICMLSLAREKKSSRAFFPPYKSSFVHLFSFYVTDSFSSSFFSTFLPEENVNEKKERTKYMRLRVKKGAAFWQKKI